MLDGMDDEEVRVDGGIGLGTRSSRDDASPQKSYRRIMRRYRMVQ